MRNYDQLKQIQRAILNNLEYYQGVKLPKPQRAGTATQISSYALLQAKKVQSVLIINKAKIKLNEAKQSKISSYIDEASRELDNLLNQ